MQFTFQGLINNFNNKLQQCIIAQLQKTNYNLKLFNVMPASHFCRIIKHFTKQQWQKQKQIEWF